MAASPIYSRRTQQALKFGNGDVATILKNIQLDIGAPHHFMDFRCRVDDAEPRRVLARALRRAPRRGTDGRGIRARHVPRDRRPHLRRHRGRDEPARPGPPAPPPAARPCGPRAALPLDDHDRSVLPAGRGASVPGDRRAGRGSRRYPIEEPAADGRARSPIRAVGTTTRATSIPTSSSKTSRTAALVIALQEVAVQSHLLLRAFAVSVSQHYGEETALELLPQIFDRARRHDRAAAGRRRSRLEDARRGRDRASACACTRCSGRAPTSTCGSRSSTTTRVRFALGPMPGSRRGRRLHLVRAARRRGRSRPRRDRARGRTRGPRVIRSRNAGRRAVRLRSGHRSRTPSRGAEAHEIALAKISGGATFVFTPRRPVRVG